MLLTEDEFEKAKRLFWIEGFEEGFVEGYVKSAGVDSKDIRAEGLVYAVVHLVKRGILSVRAAANHADVSEDYIRQVLLGREHGIGKGTLYLLMTLVDGGLISEQAAAVKANVSEDAFRRLMEERTNNLPA